VSESCTRRKRERQRESPRQREEKSREARQRDERERERRAEKRDRETSEKRRAEKRDTHRAPTHLLLSLTISYYSYFDRLISRAVMFAMDKKQKNRDIVHLLSHLYKAGVLTHDHFTKA
jgi:hypothetical protein